MQFSIQVHDDKQSNNFLSTDFNVLERHNQIEEILGTLNMEKEALEKTKLFAWVFFPLWILLSIVQTICFVLSNGRFHPLVKILTPSQPNQISDNNRLLECCISNRRNV